MTMNLFLIILAVVVVLTYLFTLSVDILNIRHTDPQLPEEFEGYYNPDKYERSQLYLIARTRLKLIYKGIVTLGFLLAFLLGGFNALDQLLRKLVSFPPLAGLLFLGIIGVILELLSLPFTAYYNFVLEERFGFNRMTLKTFIFDQLKSWLMTISIGGSALFGILSMFHFVDPLAWLYNWLVSAFFFVLFSYLAPVIFLPLTFNFEPLQEGELRDTLETYASKEDFPYAGIYSVDASKRTTKANAFFVGFGRLKRIALFDNLINNYTVDEIGSIFAHEVGHNKKKHTLIRLAINFLTMGLSFYLLSLFSIQTTFLFNLFEITTPSVYVGILIFYFLISETPIGFLFSWFSSSLSRHFEYQADAFAIKTYQQPEPYIRALKKLSVHGLSNLTPHPLKIQLDYSHPPMLKRINKIKEVVSEFDK
ncbi:MAG: M48 family metalloprotease [Candidatus Heimdallarchaeota archaeon]|nr:M48 family metalloprotease [Candidatus Heimdallarchaeota archaeon]